MTASSSTIGRPNSDIRLLVGVLVALILIAVMTLIAGPGENGPALSVHNSDPDGAMALRLWLERSGYAVHEITADPIQMGSEGTLFILAPETPYTPSEASYLRNWIRAGHMLIVAGDPDAVNELLKPYAVTVNVAFSRNPISLNAPTLITPPFDKSDMQVEYSVDTSRTDVVAHASTDRDLVIASFAEGRGQVWILGASYPFTNLGLQNSQNARLVLNLINNLPQGAVGFDEARHGFGTPHSLAAWLFNTPPGWSILLGIGLTLIYLAMRGRRFGHAVPIPEERLMREPVEYIQAMANLFRRSGQRVEMLKHYRAQLRRRLSERYKVDPHLDDMETVKTIIFRDPRVNETTLRKLLSDLSRKSVSEAELVATASDVDDWLRNML